MSSLKEIEREIEQIKQRNMRVEADKAWETSSARKFILSVFTYLAVALYLLAIDVPMPWLNAIVPTAGFLLSTLMLPFFKRQWIARFYKKGVR